MDYKKNNKWRKKNLTSSFKNALEGTLHIINHHYNARLIFLCALLAVTLGFYLKISRLELFLLGVTIMLVFITEVINTLIEDMADLINEEFHPRIKIIKDVAAGVVLVAVFFSLGVGYFMFGFRLINLWK